MKKEEANRQTILRAFLHITGEENSSNLYEGELIAYYEGGYITLEEAIELLKEKVYGPASYSGIKLM